MKKLMETTGQFSLVDMTGGASVIIHRRRPTVHLLTAFVHQRGMIGQLRYLGDVNDDATDAEFAKYWEDSEGDKQLAVESFLASFTPADLEAEVKAVARAVKAEAKKKAKEEAEAKAAADAEADKKAKEEAEAKAATEAEADKKAKEDADEASKQGK